MKDKLLPVSPITSVDKSDEFLARKLAALSHPARLALLRCLGARDACCVKDLVRQVGLAQSTVSQHIKVLLDVGLVTYQAERQSSRYSLNQVELGSVLGSLDGIVRQVCGGNCHQGGVQAMAAKENMALIDLAIENNGKS